MKVSALIPAKGFAKAKQRLAPILGAAEREVLAESMLRGVLDQIILARGIEEAFVVTADDGVAHLALSVGAKVIREREELGETEAVTFALAEMKENRIQTVMVVPGDIPLLRSIDIDDVLEQVSERISTFPLALLIPSHDRMGTNTLLLSPPDVIQPRFGYDSFAYHLSEVAAKQLPLRVLENERIALDIDEPEDLQRFLSAGIGSEIYGWLLGRGVAEASGLMHPPEGL